MKRQQVLEFPAHQADAVLEQCRRAFMQIGWRMNDLGTAGVEGKKPFALSNNSNPVTLTVRVRPVDSGCAVDIDAKMTASFGPYAARALETEMNKFNVTLFDRLDALAALRPPSPPAEAKDVSTPAAEGPRCPECHADLGPSDMACPRCGFAG